MLVEAGHRCAIPTCLASPVVIAHIVPWAKVREHAFPNLIALCPTCHARYDRGEIDRQSMLQYKANLAALNSRYSVPPLRAKDRGKSRCVRTDLASAHPEIVAEWDLVRNGSSFPGDVLITSNRMVWWRCESCRGEWAATVASRGRGTGCPRCRCKRSE